MAGEYTERQVVQAPEDGSDDLLSSQKAAIRARTLAARGALSGAERRIATARVIAALEQYRLRLGFRTIVAYAALGSELVLDGWLTRLMQSDVGIFLPFVDGDQLEVARVYDLHDGLQPGWRGIREPLPATRRPARADRIDAFVVPGAAFDAAGARIGYGAGYFDRLLARAGPGAHLIGVAFEVQMVAHIPTAAHDISMHHVITESRGTPPGGSRRVAPHSPDPER